MPFAGGAAFFKLNGSWLSLYPWNALAEDANVMAAGTGFRGITLAHVLSSKEEVREVTNRAVESGGKLIKQAQEVFWGGYSDTSPIPMCIYGRWHGIHISGPAPVIMSSCLEGS